jgi:hypothetical protein
MKIGEHALSENEYDLAIKAIRSALEEKPNEKQANDLLNKVIQHQIISEVEVVISESRTAMEAKKYDSAETALLTARDKYKNESFIKTQLNVIQNLLNEVQNLQYDIDIKEGISDAITAKENSNYKLAETLITKVLNYPELKVKDQKLAEKYLLEIKLKKNLAYFETIAFSEEEIEEGFNLIENSINDIVQYNDSEFLAESIITFNEMMIDIANEGKKKGLFDIAYFYIELVLELDPNNEEAIELKNNVNDLIAQGKAKQEEEIKLQEEKELRQQMANYISTYTDSMSRASDAMEKRNSNIINSLKAEMMMTRLPTNEFTQLSAYWRSTLDAIYNVIRLYEKIETTSNSKSNVDEYVQINEQIKVAISNMGKGKDEVKRLKEEYTLTNN